MTSRTLRPFDTFATQNTQGERRKGFAVEEFRLTLMVSELPLAICIESIALKSRIDFEGFCAILWIKNDRALHFYR